MLALPRGNLKRKRDDVSMLSRFRDSCGPVSGGRVAAAGSIGYSNWGGAGWQVAYVGNLRQLAGFEVRFIAWWSV